MVDLDSRKALLDEINDRKHILKPQCYFLREEVSTPKPKLKYREADYCHTLRQSGESLIQVNKT